MVAGLVNPQGSALSDEPVPSPEIVSPMRRIKIPVKIDGGEFPNFSFPKELPHLYPVGRIAVIECNPALFPAPFFRIDYLLHLYFVDGHRFLDNNISSRLHAPDDELIMCAVYSCDN